MKHINLSRIAHPLRLDAGERAAGALSHIAEWGWLRSIELGYLMFGRDNDVRKNTDDGRKYAHRLIQKLLGLKLLIARPLPGANAGMAYVLSNRGAPPVPE
jgi:hypothetical protein